MPLALVRGRSSYINAAIYRGENPFVVKPGAKTFAEAAAAYLKSVEKNTWSAAHRAQWYSTLLGPGAALGPDYCARLHAMRVDAITANDVLETLQTILVRLRR